MPKWYLLCSLFFYAILGHSQDSIHLQLLPTDTSLAFLNEQINYPSHCVDSLNVYAALGKVLTELHQAAYLEASFDSIYIDKKDAKAFLHLGGKYEWLYLQNGNIPIAILKELGIDLKTYKNKPFSYSKVLALEEQLLTYAENNGYPFAEIRLDSFFIKKEGIAASLFWQKNNRITIDSINIIGTGKISATYLHHYLGIKKGALYDQSQVLTIKKQLESLPFVQSKQDPKITFKGNRAILNLFLEKKQANRFDILFGVLPNSNPLLQRKLLVTGSGKIELHNAFGLAESISASFQQLRPETQELDLAFAYPYVFNLPFGVELDFDLYKRDTTYLDLNYDAGLNYFFDARQYLQAFWKQSQSNLLTVDKNALLQSRQLPNNLDVKNTFFGLEYGLERLDYRFNPRKGWQFVVRAAVGNKVIEPNNIIVNLEDLNDTTFSFQSLYDAFDLQSVNYRLEGKVAMYYPIARQSTIKMAIQNAMILSENAIFQNEVYRIGGNRLLRGFDEEAIFASWYTVLTLEYRFLLSKNSNVYLFADSAYIENKMPQNTVFQRPLGFGAGLNFDTAVGVFGISIALGRDFNNPSDFFDFRSPKLHFGYVSLFGQ